MITLPDFHDIIHLHRYLQDVPFEVTPSDLYDAGSLYGFDRNSSVNPDWEHTYDKQTYNHYIAQGKLPQDAKEVLARSLHDYCMTKALDTYLKAYEPQQVVGVMGGHNLKRTVYKAGNARIDILIALHVARQQNLIASAYDHDHARLYLREMQALALRTFPCGKGGRVGQCRSAMRAETHAASPAEQAPGARIMKILLL